MAARRQRGVGHRGNELAKALGANRIPARNAKCQPRLEQRRFGAFEHVAPTAIGKLIERNGNKGLIGKRTVQIEALGDLDLTRSQLALEHKGHAARVTLGDRRSYRGRPLNDAVRARFVAGLNFIGVEPLDARMCRGAAYLADHDDPKAPAFFVGGANGQAQARTRTPHNQTRAVSYTVEALSDKSRHIPLKRRVIHGRNRDVPTRIDCQCRGPGSSQGLGQDVQLGIAIHDLPLSAATCNRRRSHDRVFQN